MVSYKKLLNILKKVEEPDFTFVEGSFPPVFENAEGIIVKDVEGNEYLDFSSFFGVSFTGHSQAFIKEEAKKGFFHGLGDLIPSKEKILLMDEISNIIGNNFKGILLQNGSDAVEACLRSAYLYKKNKTVIAFKGAYHGTALTALSVTYSSNFRERFSDLLPFRAKFFDYSLDSLEKIDSYLSKNQASSIIVEPIQGRAGIKIPPKGFLKGLEKISNEKDIPLIFDEVFTGFGKTGEYFAKDYFKVKPDLIAFGKGLTGAFPLSGCFGKREIMDLWGESRGEATYTFTFSGNPFFSRVALRNIKKIESLNFRKKVREIERFLSRELERLKSIFTSKIKGVRGLGTMWGIELFPPLNSFQVFKRLLLNEKIITLPSGEKGEALEILPPLIAEEKDLEKLIKALERTFETF